MLLRYKRDSECCCGTLRQYVMVWQREHEGRGRVEPEAIEDQIERNETKMTYRDYRIWLRSYELKSGGWVPRALVIVPSTEGNGEQELLEPGTSVVSTREEADEQAFAMGKQWIDERQAGREQNPIRP